APGAAPSDEEGSSGGSKEKDDKMDLFAELKQQIRDLQDKVDAKATDQQRQTAEAERAVAEDLPTERESAIERGLAPPGAEAEDAAGEQGAAEAAAAPRGAATEE
ncbi:unnamed protein product, partial [Prorocentrum cordatum]